MYRLAPLTLLLSALACHGIVAERCSGAEPDSDDYGRLVLRISRDAIGPVQHQSFENEQEVDDLVLGTSVKGTAKTTAKCVVERCEEARVGGLRLVVTGVSVTDTEGRNGPAIITSTTTTEFTATAPLSFSIPGGFATGEIEVEAESKTETKDIQSTQKGIAGTFVKKLAEKKVKQSLPEAQKIARELAIKRIRGEVANELEKRLTTLNASCARLRPVLAIVKVSKEEPVHLLADDGDLVVCVGALHIPSIDELPALTAAAELWLASTSIDAKTGEAIARLTERPSFPVGVGNVSQRPARQDARPHLERQPDWWVVRHVADSDK